MADEKRTDVLYVPGTYKEMIDEAKAPIDPAKVPERPATWGEDRTVLDDPGHPACFLAKNLSAKCETFSKPATGKFDTRRYFQFPLLPRPAITLPEYEDTVSTTAEESFKYSSTVTLSTDSEGPAVAEVQQDAWYNKGKATYQFVGVDPVENYVNDPVFQSFITAINKRLITHWMGVCKSVNTKMTPEQLVAWFETDDARTHFRGWCEKLGKMQGAKAPGTCDAIRKGTEQRGKASAHDRGCGIDLNYDYNPWVPLFTDSSRELTGENTAKRDPGETKMDPIKKYKINVVPWSACCKVYDRALRLFIAYDKDPVYRKKLKKVIGEGDPDLAAEVSCSMEYFASTYYRNNSDWVPGNKEAKNPPYSVEDAFRHHQILNWSLRLYFNYHFSRLANKLEGDGGYVTGSVHSLAPAADKDKKGKVTPTSDEAEEIIQKLLDDVNAGTLPETATICIAESTANEIIKEGSGTDTYNALFTDGTLYARLESLKIQPGYPFDVKYAVKHEDLYCIKLSGLSTEPLLSSKSTLGYLLCRQMQKDYADTRECLKITGAKRPRDPSFGVFNQNYDVVLAWARMFSDKNESKLVRCFGAFGRQAGDMQHFDYGLDYRSGGGGGLGKGSTWACCIRTSTKAFRAKERETGVIACFDLQGDAAAEACKNELWGKGESYECWLYKPAGGAAAQNAKLWTSNGKQHVLGCFLSKEGADEARAPLSGTPYFNEKSGLWECVIIDSSQARRVKHTNGGIIGVYNSLADADKEKMYDSAWGGDEKHCEYWECWIEKTIGCCDAYIEKGRIIAEFPDRADAVKFVESHLYVAPEKNKSTDKNASIDKEIWEVKKKK